MKRFMIERDIPQVGTLEREQLRDAAKTSNGALRELGPDIQWIESFVAADKTFCIYLAKDEDIIKRHAEISAELDVRDARIEPAAVLETLGGDVVLPPAPAE